MSNRELTKYGEDAAHSLCRVLGQGMHALERNHTFVAGGCPSCREAIRHLVDGATEQGGTVVVSTDHSLIGTRSDGPHTVGFTSTSAPSGGTHG